MSPLPTNRVLFWVQNLLGSGHVGRAQALSGALLDEGLEVTLVNGGRTLPWLGRPDLEVVELPPVSAADAGFTSLVDADGRPVDEDFWARRSRLLFDLFERLRPAAVVTEMFPFGRRVFRAELLPLLERAEAAGALRVASVRDVLVEAPDDKHRWMRDMAVDRYDLLLAHTDPAVIPFEFTFPYRRDLGSHLIETGFIAPAARLPETSAGRDEVIVSAGGGRVGKALLATAVEARRLIRSPVIWRVIAPDEVEAGALRRGAGDGVVVDRQRPDFRDLLANGLLSISQAGYNTVWEALAYEKRMVLVPFTHAGETEQQTRAARLADLGLAVVLAERDLAPRALAAAVESALEAPVPRRPRIDLGGAGRSARLIAERIRSRRRR